jgi:geranylgeranyl reductase family protein
MRERVDVVVVGAGPAGSATAARLATGGARVVLIDRARFPRDKPCGGGLTLRAAKQLPTSPGPVVEQVVTAIAFRDAAGARFVHAASTPLVLMTQRRRLDQLLASAAADAGADFRDGVRLRHAWPGGVETDHGVIEAAVVVCADGANGPCGRLLGLGQRRLFAVALEGNVAYQDRDAAWPRSEALLEIGTVPGGYGWVFPKAAFANIGVGGWASQGPALREHLAGLCARERVPIAAVRQLRGHRLPFRHRATVIARGRVLAVGDAAGLVDPISGDGLYEAAVSARLAAETILDLFAGRIATLDPYAARVDAALGRHLATAWLAKGLLERAPRFGVAIARHAGPLLAHRIAGVTHDGGWGRWGGVEAFARRLIGADAAP